MHICCKQFLAFDLLEERKNKTHKNRPRVLYLSQTIKTFLFINFFERKTRENHNSF